MIPETVTPAGLRERAKIMRDILDESCARHLELAANEIERLRTFDFAQCSKEWRCFHCDEVFTDAKAAANHFGVDHIGDETLCQMAQVDGGIAKVIADLSEELQRYRSEDNESFREFYRLGADHRQALIREEQKGYDRGLADGRTVSDTSTLQSAPPANGSLPSGESDPSVTIDLGGADTLRVALEYIKVLETQIEADRIAVSVSSPDREGK